LFFRCDSQKKAATRLPFLLGWNMLGPFGKKKARGPGRLRADGKIPSRGQFEGTGSVQNYQAKAQRITFAKLANKATRHRVFLVSGQQASPAGSENRGSLPKAFFSVPCSDFSIFWWDATKRRCVNALWGKVPAMAVTKCILLQEVESLGGKNGAQWAH